MLRQVTNCSLRQCVDTEVRNAVSSKSTEIQKADLQVKYIRSNI